MSKDSSIELPKQNRYAYIKYGNGVEVLRQIGPLPATDIDGPFTYNNQFLKTYGNNPILLFSYSTCNESLEMGNVKAITVHQNTNLFRPFGKIFLKIKNASLMSFHLIKFRPNHILCTCTGIPLWISFIISRIFSIAIVHSCHKRVEPADHFFHKIISVIDNFVIRQISFVICHGPYLKQQLIDIGIKKSNIIEFRAGFRNFYNTTKNSPYKKDLTDAGKSFLILFVGRIEETKGVFDLLKACRPRLETDRSLKLIFLGNGADLEQLNNTVTNYRLNNQVLCLGKIPYDKLGSIICQSKFVVIPAQSTLGEGYCKSAVEPLILGVTVIVPNYGPFPFFIEDGINGTLFKPDSVESLRDSICALLDDPARLERLTAGAKKTGHAIMIDPQITFIEAVQNAFKNTKVS